LPGSGLSYTEQHRNGNGAAGGLLLLLAALAVLAFVFLA
jgi:hypothetical protein